jgi:hypothetical protein
LVISIGTFVGCQTSGSSARGRVKRIMDLGLDVDVDVGVDVDINVKMDM